MLKVHKNCSSNILTTLCFCVKTTNVKKSRKLKPLVTGAYHLQEPKSLFSTVFIGTVGRPVVEIRP